MEELKYIEINKVNTDEKNRIRTTSGNNINSIKDSIKNLGLFHPIIINKNNKLIAGYRRLKACKELGWNLIPVFIKENINELEEVNIEIQENLRRKNLSPYEIDIAVAKWKRIYEKIYPETKYLAHVKSGRRDSKGRIQSFTQMAESSSWINESRNEDDENESLDKIKRFTKIASELANVSERSIRDRVRVGEAILLKKFNEKEIEDYENGIITHTEMLEKEKKRRKNNKKGKRKKGYNNNSKPSNTFGNNLIEFDKYRFCNDCKNAVFSCCPECGKQIIICDKGYLILKGKCSEICEKFVQ
ncbi:MAG: ParB/RepB/Spo0J family partition protein [Promethearchaeota archaeon]